ncbi:hypothetical protein [Nonomuraea sp. LPB2021202275-12-8]|uniref:hypothetical protein n=1 Tax=Nonomuraea sp. LPB2021202275-12-8 TaxID=3120159 RepID=UPI00300CAB80
MSIELLPGPALETGDEVMHLQTAAFDAPAGSFLVAGFAGGAESSFEISGGGLTWTARQAGINGWAHVWTAPCPTDKTAITILGGGEDFTWGGLKVWVLDGQDPSAPLGKITRGTVATNNANVAAYTATGPGSLGFCVAYETSISNSNAPTSTDVYESYSMLAVYGDPGGGLFMRKAATASATNQSIPFNLDAPGTGTAGWEWVALEVLPMPGGGGVRVLQSMTAVHRAASW